MKKMRKIVNLCAGIFSLLCLLLLAAGIVWHCAMKDSGDAFWLLQSASGFGAIYYVTDILHVPAYITTICWLPDGSSLSIVQENPKFSTLFIVVSCVFLLLHLINAIHFFKKNGFTKKKNSLSAFCISGFMAYCSIRFFVKNEYSLAPGFLDLLFTLLPILVLIFQLLICAAIAFNLVYTFIDCSGLQKYKDTVALNNNLPFDPSAGVATANRQTPVTPVSVAKEAPLSAQTIAAETLARQKFCAPVQPVVTEQQPQPSPSSAATQPLSAPAAAQPAAAGIQAEDAADKAQPAAETFPAAKTPPEKKETTQKESILSTHVFNLKTCFFLPILLFGVEIVVVCLAKASGSHGAGIVLWLLALVNLAYAGWKMVQAVQSVKRHVVITTTRVYLQNYATGNIVISVPIADIKNVSTETTAASIRSDYGNLVLFLTGGQKIKFDFILDIAQAKENILLAKRKAENNALSL